MTGMEFVHASTIHNLSMHLTHFTSALLVPVEHRSQTRGWHGNGESGLPR